MPRMTGADGVIDLFPPGTSRDGDGMLRVGGCRLDELAAEYGTPALVVAVGAVRQQARDYREQLAARWPDSRVAFASKAFPCTAVQRLMVSEGLWLDVAGGGEIVTALAAGADPATLILHGNAKTTEEIELAVSSGVGTIVVDNFDDIDRLAAAVPAGHVQGCLVRVIPGVQSSTYPAYATGHAGSKFGLAPEAARQAIARIEANGARLRMDGLHTHVGSQILRGGAGRWGGAAGSTGRLRRLRPRRRPRLPLHLC
jgi:diaminopimelate decarboxylase